MITIKVLDMRCLHCKATIEKALSKKGVQAEVDLENHEVKISDDSQKELAIKCIEKAGFTPTL